MYITVHTGCYVCIYIKLLFLFLLSACACYCWFQPLLVVKC